MALKMETIEVSAGLIFRAGKLLITQRYPDAHVGGLWEFPGGKREGGESFEECLKRELREELGIEVDVKELIESITHDYPERRVKLSFYRCQLLKGEPATIGCPALCWVSVEELEKYDFPPADARLLQKLKETPQLWAGKETEWWGETPSSPD